jgi:acyl-CoA hydrolase
MASLSSGRRLCAERAKEFIAIAHPDFLAELREEAQKLY